MEYSAYPIRKIIDSTQEGGVRIPAFQRGFVWDMERVAHLMDSIYKGYPIGSLLFWRTTQHLSTEKSLGQFNLKNPSPTQQLDYVIDGQQRLTSIFTVFQSELKPEIEIPWLDIYFDLTVDDDAQNCQFLALKDDEKDIDKHFPLKALFDPVQYRKATDHFTDNEKVINRIDKLQRIFQEATIPVQILKTDQKSKIAVVFERVNRLGMALDTLQLLSAWTWSEDFDIVEKFGELRDSLSHFGFEEIGDNIDLILTTASAIITKEAAPEKLLDVSGKSIREQFDLVEQGIRGAIDFLRSELNVYSLKAMPFPTMLVPLAVFFAKEPGKEVSYDSQTLTKIKNWFWRSCLANRYSSQTRRTAEADCIEMEKLRSGNACEIDTITTTISSDAFKKTVFRTTNAFAKTFILLLSQNNPRTFISGKKVETEKVLQAYNRSEFHHIYPKAHLGKCGVSDSLINCLANFCFLSAAENKKISNKKPSEYLKMVAGDKEIVLNSAFCTEDMFDDNFEKFINKRADMLYDFAKKIANIN